MRCEQLMCGILGVLNYDDAISGRFVNALKTLHHRGPDANAIYHNDNIILGHTRLSIIDVGDRSNQPFHYKHLTVIFNGEIYNHKELRQELETDAPPFQTLSDTEVIIRGFERHGPKIFSMLNGMFSLCIFDNEHEVAFLARDRMGQKPLLWGAIGKSIVFCSELKAIEALDLPLTFNSLYETSIKCLGFCIDPITKYNEFNSLEPGTYLKFDMAGNTQHVVYYNLAAQIHKNIERAEVYNLSNVFTRAV